MGHEHPSSAYLPVISNLEEVAQDIALLPTPQVISWELHASSNLQAMEVAVAGRRAMAIVTEVGALDVGLTLIPAQGEKELNLQLCKLKLRDTGEAHYQTEDC